MRIVARYVSSMSPKQRVKRMRARIDRVEAALQAGAEGRYGLLTLHAACAAVAAAAAA